MNYINLFFITIFSILLTTNNVLAANWYLATTGSDTNSSLVPVAESPIKIIKRRIAMRAAGSQQ